MYERKISLKAARINANLKQVEAGATIQKSRNYICRMEAGEVKPTAYELERLATVYGWPLEAIELPALSKQGTIKESATD